MSVYIVADPNGSVVLDFLKGALAEHAAVIEAVEVETKDFITRLDLYGAKLLEDPDSLLVAVDAHGIQPFLHFTRRGAFLASRAQDIYTMALSRAHNDARVLCIGIESLTMQALAPLARTFVTTPFSGNPRHLQRIDMAVRIGTGTDSTSGFAYNGAEHFDVALGSDHAAVKLKERLYAYLSDRKYRCFDCGTHTENSVHYPLFGAAVAHTVAEKKAAQGIVLCGTGIGITNAANRVLGARAIPFYSPVEIDLYVRPYGINILGIGAWVSGAGLAEDMVARFMGHASPQRAPA